MDHTGHTHLGARGRRLLASVAVPLLLLTGTFSATATADPAAPTSAPSPDRSEAEALAVLEEVITALHPPSERSRALSPGASTPGGQDLTTRLIALARVQGDLPPAAQRTAQRLFARPAKGSKSEIVNYGKRTPKVVCNKRVCVHWVKGGRHGATKAWAKRARRQVTGAWNSIVNSLGYRKPASDGGKGNPKAVTGHRLDVYLGDIDSSGAYGYAVPENTRTGGSYLVLDNDYKSVTRKNAITTRPRHILRVSSAHEFFHVVQFAYKPLPDVWLTETTATWVEEQLHDEINDNRQYLPVSVLKRPAVPLDSAAPWFYGNWIFFEHLSQRFGPNVVRNIWKRVGKGKNTVPALKLALKQRGSTLPRAFTRFAADNTIPAHTYAEGSAYPQAQPAKQHLGSQEPTMPWRSVAIDHLAAATLRFVPEGTLGPNWRINVEVRAPRRVRAELVGRREDGQFVRQQIRATPGGSTLTADFSTQRMTWVAVTIANAGVKPKHDGTTVRIRAALSSG